ncbi:MULTISPECIES: ClpX C4-type zinc finger protein [unclassified Bradyrhizobium]|uniref:ClpX C4-type zinc finger protein n=1 Tax=unclassified Bradyrhizobium TaxID=2631580 RepID=UPI0032EA2D9B
MSNSDPRPGQHCSFCGKHLRDIRELILGPGVANCGECVELGTTICREERKSFYLRSPAEDRKLAAQTGGGTFCAWPRRPRYRHRCNCSTNGRSDLRCRKTVAYLRRAARRA